MTDRRLIRLAPVPFGFGPVGKAIHIARAFRARVGTEIRLELIVPERFASAASLDLFDGIFSDLNGPTGNADAVVTVMNVSGIRSAVASGTRVYVVDSLAWLWDAPLDVAKGAFQYFYQSLPVLPVPPQNLHGLPKATPIPAIAGFGSPPSNRYREANVVSLSGIETPFENSEFQIIPYPQLFFDALSKAIKEGLVSSDRLCVFGNRTVLNQYVPSGLAHLIADGRQSSFLSAASSAKSVLVPPGLTSLLECMRAGVPVKMLPPQNYSQFRIHKAFRESGIEGLRWDGLASEWLECAVVPEALGSELSRSVLANTLLSGRGLDPKLLSSLMASEQEPLGGEQISALIGGFGGEFSVVDAVLGDIY